jgi:hypothetical protein
LVAVRVAVFFVDVIFYAAGFLPARIRPRTEPLSGCSTSR